MNGCIREPKKRRRASCWGRWGWEQWVLGVDSRTGGGVKCMSRGGWIARLIGGRSPLCTLPHRSFPGGLNCPPSRPSRWYPPTLGRRKLEPEPEPKQQGEAQRVIGDHCFLVPFPGIRWLFITHYTHRSILHVEVADRGLLLVSLNVSSWA